MRIFPENGFGCRGQRTKHGDCGVHIERSRSQCGKGRNGKVALEQYQISEEGYYDAILMDLMMPVMDGYEAARQIRSSDRADAKTIPIVAMSANAYMEEVKNVLQLV